VKRPNSRTSTAGERDRPKRPDTVTCTEVLNLPRDNYCSLSAGNRTLRGSPRRGRPTVHLSSNEGGGLIPGVRDPVYSPQSCEGVLFCTGAGQETPREPQKGCYIDALTPKPGFLGQTQIPQKLFIRIIRTKHRVFSALVCKTMGEPLYFHHKRVSECHPWVSVF